MIKKIKIENFAIIDSLEATFTDGLNVITGETGSGKSLILNAIDILFGGYLSINFLRNKEKKLEILGQFQFEGENLSISRRYFKKKSIYLVNDKKSTKSEIISLSSKLFQFQKQHDSNKLLVSSEHINFLDQYSNNSNDLMTIQKVFIKLNNTNRDLQDTLNNENIYRDKFDLYNYQLKELNSINLDTSNELEIAKKFKVMLQSKNILKELDTYNKNNEYSENSTSDQISHLKTSLSKYSSIDKSLNEIVNRLNNIIIEINDIDSEIYSLQKKYYYNPEDLEIYEAKVNQYEEIKRKYGGSLRSAHDYKNKIKNELKNMPTFDTQIQKIKKKQEELNDKYQSLAAKLTKIRKSKSKTMSKDINKFLKDMDMPSAEIKINIEKNKILADNGTDICEFFAVTNKGEPFKPIKDIASGGEISRIMLAINLVLDKSKFSSSMIFDEIDTGISGSTANKVGILLKELSVSRQVVIISHLAQIASKSDNHLFVKKIEHEHRVVSNCEVLDKSDHEKEIARMLSGNKITKYSLKQANELISNG